MPGLETRPFPGGWLLTGAPLCGGRSFALLERFFRQTAELVTGTPCPSAYPAMLRALEAPMPDDVPQFRTTFAGTRQDPAERAVLSGLDEENYAPVPLLHALLRGMADELSACYRAALKAGCAPAGRLLAPATVCGAIPPCSVPSRGASVCRSRWLPSRRRPPAARRCLHGWGCRRLPDL